MKQLLPLLALLSLASAQAQSAVSLSVDGRAMGQTTAYVTGE